MWRSSDCPATRPPNWSSRAAKLKVLVLGHRGRGATAGTFLSSVGLNCVLLAHCPVTRGAIHPGGGTGARHSGAAAASAVEVRTSHRTTVADVMTTAVVSVPPSTPVPDVASTLFTAAVRRPVFDDDGDLHGVISEG